jgi:glycosyltransferase involved in cell wall biosynthesis
VGQDDILPFYRSADAFALSSFSEGVPVVMMEAMATELPVVAPRITGVPELVDDGRHGILVSPGRSDLLAEALGSLADDPERRARMGREGRRRVEDDFEVLASARQLRALLGRADVQPAADGVDVREPRPAASASM